MQTHTDVIVVGGGLVGASMACALGEAGLHCSVIEATPPESSQQPSFDERTIALTYSARQVFSGLGLWPALINSGELWPIRDIEVSDRGHSGRCHLSHRDIGLDALGYVVPTRVLGRVLHERLRLDERIELRCPAVAIDMQRREGAIRAEIDEAGQQTVLTAPLVVLADGGRSPIARRLGFESESRAYAQSALVTIVASDRPHDGRAYERFVGAGPLALLPVRTQDFAVAWTQPTEEARRRLEFGDEKFCAELQACFGDRAGRFQAAAPRSLYPLSRARLRPRDDARVVAVGNAAHVVHPVAGQGFNLGLRDVVGLTEHLSRARAAGQDIGGPETLRPYLRSRVEETRRVSGFTDAMIGIFSSTFSPLRRTRGAALSLLDRLPAAKRELLYRTTGVNSAHSRIVRRIVEPEGAAGSSALQYDVVIVGAGLVGGAMACALGDTDYRVALVDKALPAPPPEAPDDFDLRINAYNRAAEELLRRLDVWERLPAARVFPFRHVYVGNERGSGSVSFSAREVGETHLGHFIENRLVTHELINKALDFSNVDVLSGRDISGVRFGADRVLLESATGPPLEAGLLIGADGANSRVREAAGIGVRLRPYAQRCIVGTIEFSGDLDETAWQRFLYSGPLGLLPLAPGTCSLAWSCADELSESLMAMSDSEFIAALDRATDGRLGAIRRVGQRGVFPLTARDAMSYVGERTALIGDAAHVVHPLAGLGANIGFMDVATLAKLLKGPARSGDRDIGGERLLRRYERKRRGENKLLMTAMSAFNTVFSNDDALLGVMRDGGLRVANQLSPARKFLMRRAMWMDFSVSGRRASAATPHPRKSGQQS